MDNYVSYDLTEEQWKRIQPLLPPENRGRKGHPGKDDRIMLNGMLRLNHSGAQWRQILKCYGPWQSVYARFAMWRDDGVWEKIFTELSQDADTENLSIDSTCVKVHERSHGEEKTGNKAVGRTRGGLNTKIHAIVDGLGNPVAFLLSPGNDNNSVHAVELMNMADIAGSNLLGNKAMARRKSLRIAGNTGQLS